MCLLLLDMNRPVFRPDGSNIYNYHHQDINPQQDDFHGLVSYPPRYYSRPPRPPVHGSSAVRPVVPRLPSTTKPESDFQTNDPNFLGTFTKSSVHQSTSVSDQHVDASISATSGGTSDEVKQLKWQAGQGPIVDLRLLVPGKVG